MPDESTNVGFLQDLWDRRFFQYGATYLGVSWALIQFAEWLSNRYDLSSSIVEKLIVFLVVMLPAVLIFIYNHGRPGADRWKPVEKILMPGSFVLALILSLALFNSSSLKASTETVSVFTEEGDTLTRVIPKMEFTKNFVIFPFKNNTGNASNNWMEVGGAYLFDKDIEQDMRSFSVQPLSLKYYYESYNYEYLDDIPFATKLKIAQDFYSDYFITGELNRGDTGLQLHLKVYASSNGQEFYNEMHTGKDIFEMIDAANASLADQVYLPESLHSIQTIDLPVADLVSSDSRVLKLFIEGQILESINIQNLPDAIRKLEEAVSLDPACAECYASLAQLYFSASDEVKGKENSDKAVQLSSSLAERQQLRIRFHNYLNNNQPDKAVLLSENWRKIYPNDYTPYSNLIAFYQRSLQWGKAKVVALAAHENDHKGNLLKTLASLYIATENFDEAEKYINEFSELYPHKAKEMSLLGEIYTMKGELEKARNFYEEYLIMEPNDIQAYIKLATVEQKLGSFKNSLDYCHQALEKANQTRDSLEVYQCLEAHYERLGQFDNSFAINDKIYNLMAKTFPIATAKQMTFYQQIPKWVQTGNDQLFRERLTELKNLLPQSKDITDCIGHFLYYLSHENASQFEENTNKCGDLVIRFVGSHFKYAMEGAKARFNGEYEKAIENYEKMIDSTGTDASIYNYDLCAVYRLAGNYREAEQLVNELLILDPHQPLILIEASKVMKARGKNDLALRYYNQAMEIWSEADENFKKYQEAKEYGKELESS